MALSESSPKPTISDPAEAYQTARTPSQTSQQQIRSKLSSKKSVSDSEIMATIGGHNAAKKLIIMCGPSGAGKSTLIKRLRKDYPDGFGFSVSHTTRGPRTGEIDGVDYHFVQKPLMEEKIEASEMLEHAHVHSNIYGTSLEAVQKVIDMQKKCILDIDVQGVESVRRSAMHATSLYIFLAPPSLQALEDRLRDRGTETEEKIQTRLTNARSEMEYKDKPDFWDHVIVNDDLDKAYTLFESAVAGEMPKAS